MNLKLSSVPILAMCLLLSSCAQKDKAAMKSFSSDISALSASAAQTQPGDSSSAQGGASGAKSVLNGAAGSHSPAAASKAPISGTDSSKAPAGRVFVNVTIPEGYSVSQIGSKLEQNKICKKADFLSAVNNYNFSYYPLISKIGNDPRRCYKMEGYLFPDTYQLYQNMKPQDAIGVMLRGAESKIGSKYSYPGMTTDQIVTLASIIQREVSNSDDMKNVSSVFHNRLSRGMKLWADSTIIYIERYVKPNLTGDINRYNSYYNTEKCPALPEGPICSPGAKALAAAVQPNNTKYLFFVTDAKSNKTYYAATQAEQDKNCILAGVTSEPSVSSGAQTNP